MTIFIESRICEELGISYNNSGEESTINKDDFIEKWEKICLTKDWITRDIPDGYGNASFSDVIGMITGNKMNLINKGYGYFELK